MSGAMWRAVLLLPVNVLVVIPAVILWIADGTPHGAQPVSPAHWTLWTGVAMGAPALMLMGWTMRLFMATGSGTPAPWDPIKKLVIEGPYRHLRNPMISGVIAGLIAEALVLRAPALAGWALFFFAANMIYLPISEEPALLRRYGDPYRRYRENVPRWLPRITPWRDREGDRTDPITRPARRYRWGRRCPQ